MDGLAAASSVIAVVDMAAKVATLCFQYLKEVTNASNSINKLQSQVKELETVSASLHSLLMSPNGSHLKVSQKLHDAVQSSLSQLEGLHDRLGPKPGRKVMHRFGFRALKWPFDSKEVQVIMEALRRYTQTISVALHIDQTFLLSAIDHRIILDRLRIAEGASFDSHAQEHSPCCLPNTRVDLLAQISRWAQNSDAEPIFWLNGMAGTGKSTICRTVAQSLADSHQLAASFFFKKGEADRQSLSKFFMTIAAGLIKTRPSTAQHIKEILDTDQSITTTNSREQFEKLLLQPLLKSESSGKQELLTIVVDALDECERDEDIKRLIQLFSRFKAEIPGRVKVFVTSRPELPLRLGFRSIQGTYEGLILHEIPAPVIEKDISIFLGYELAKIQNEYNASMEVDQQLAKDWPGQSNFDALVQLAIPLFIVATTICRFIGDIRIATPNTQLEKVISRTGDQTSQMHKIYRPILDNLTAGLSVKHRNEVLGEFQLVIGSIITLSNPLSISALARLLDISKDVISGRLTLLHSVLSVPSSTEVPVRLLHLSFRDFLIDPNEYDLSFWIEEKKIHANLAANCLRVLECLKQDPCGIKAPGTPRSAIDTSNIERFLPPAIQYACLYWPYHTEKAGINIADGGVAHRFLESHFLHWIESLALMGRAMESLGLIKTLQSQLEPQQSTELSQLLEDAFRFLRRYISAIDSTPLQLYSSLLVFAPKNSKIRALYQRSADWITVQPDIEENWNPCMQTLEGHAGATTAVAFSHDASTVVSLSSYLTLHIWQADTGACVQTFKDMDMSPSCVAFSRDAMLVAAASKSQPRIFKVWDTKTHKCVHSFAGHCATVLAVAFSPDSKLLVSADNNILCVWQVDTGDCIQTSNGSLGHVVAFSHDSKFVAVGSGKSTVSIWSPTAGEVVRSLKGDGDFIRSVAFSHDSARVVAAEGEMVHVWQVDTGELLHNLKGYAGRVTSLAISHDSTLLACSDDSSVRIWCASTGECVQTFKGHAGIVNSVVFSHDSELIASSSSDSTIRIWNTKSRASTLRHQSHGGRIHCLALSYDSALMLSASTDRRLCVWDVDTLKCKRKFEGHQGVVKMAVFSHDLTVVASASYDKTVCIWHIDRGECLRTLKGHCAAVFCVAFSGDSSLLVSGSADRTLRIWRTSTGECLRTLQGSTGECNSVAFTHGSSYVVSTSGKDVHVWDVDTGMCIKTLDGHTHFITQMLVCRDSGLLATINGDGIRVWDVGMWKCLQFIKTKSRPMFVEFDWKRSRIWTDFGWFAIDCTATSSPRSVEPALEDDPLPKPNGYGLSGYDLRGYITGFFRDIRFQKYSPNINRSWITLDGKDFLWLPVEVRPSAVHISGSTVILGCYSGEVLIMKLAAY